MEKRKIIFGTYDTAAQHWTLAGWTLSSPEQQTNYIVIPGRKGGSLDLSTVLTEGEPVYNSRALSVNLETSEGGRISREFRINEMLNQLDGLQHHIVLPDDPDHYLVGRVHVSKQYNDLAHAKVIVTAVCEPWRYSKYERIIGLVATSTAKTTTLTNAGRLTVVPVVEVTGGSVSLGFGESTWTLSAGTYQLPDLSLKPGEHTLTYSGSGSVGITYREAVL